MYFENRVNTIEAKTSLREIAAIFFGRHFSDYQAFSFGDFVFVSDANPSGTGVLEVAVVNQKEGKQVESLTVGWMKTLTEVVEAFEDSLDSDTTFKLVKVPTADSVPMRVHLECGCCGNFFRDDFEYQQQFDQDSGFGICPGCEKYYK